MKIDNYLNLEGTYILKEGKVDFIERKKQESVYLYLKKYMYKTSGPIRSPSPNLVKRCRSPLMFRPNFK